MKKALSLLLCAALLLSLCCAAPACAEEPENTPEEQGPRLEDLEDQVFSLSLACWMAEFYCGVPDSLILWDALGWYAALDCRVTERKLLPARTAKDFLRSLRFEGDVRLPEDWEEYGVVKPVIGAGSTLYYDFASHKAMFDEMIGIDTELSMALTDDHTVQVCITRHGETETTKTVYRVLFAPNPDPFSPFPYQLCWVWRLSAEPEMGEDLNFAWEDLLQANLLSNVFALTPALCITNPSYGSGTATWLFSHGGHTAILLCANGYVSGTYGEWSFDTYDLPDGGHRTCVGYHSDDPYEDLYDEYYLMDYLNGITKIELLREEEELLWLNCAFYGDVTEQIAVDKETLLLREIDFCYDEAYEPSVTLFDCSQPLTELGVLDGWNGPLRTVTAHWEDYENEPGELSWRTEELCLPADWEYLPYDARWGDYTPYNNDAYLGDYSYPGDGIDYDVYFTLVKG